MKCRVCQVAFVPTENEGACPACGYQATPGQPVNADEVLAKREELKDAITTPRAASRITTWDRWRPWAAVALGFLFFMLWIKACGRAFW